MLKSMVKKLIYNDNYGVICKNIYEAYTVRNILGEPLSESDMKNIEVLMETGNDICIGSTSNTDSFFSKRGYKGVIPFNSLFVDKSAIKRADLLQMLDEKITSLEEKIPKGISKLTQVHGYLKCLKDLRTEMASTEYMKDVLNPILENGAYVYKIKDEYLVLSPWDWDTTKKHINGCIDFGYEIPDTEPCNLDTSTTWVLTYNVVDIKLLTNISEIYFGNPYHIGDLRKNADGSVEKLISLREAVSYYSIPPILEPMVIEL